MPHHHRYRIIQAPNAQVCAARALTAIEPIAVQIRRLFARLPGESRLRSATDVEVRQICSGLGGVEPGASLPHLRRRSERVALSQLEPEHVGPRFGPRGWVVRQRPSGKCTWERRHLEGRAGPPLTHRHGSTTTARAAFWRGAYAPAEIRRLTAHRTRRSRRADAGRGRGRGSRTRSGSSAPGRVQDRASSGQLSRVRVSFGSRGSSAPSGYRPGRPPRP